MIDIKDIQGTTRFSVKINPGAKGKFSLMKEDYVILPFSSLSPVDFQVGDYVDLRGVFDASMGGKLAKIYQIVDLSYPSYNASTGGYDYELRLDAYYWIWKTKIFKYTPETGGQEASWSLTASLDVQMGVFLRNLKALGYTYGGKDYTFSIDSTVENKAVAMSYKNMNLIDAMFSMADKWGCDCWVTDHVINFGRCEFSDTVKIELGKEAKDISRSDSKGTYATRIYAFGSTRNIPTNYRPVDQTTVVNGIVQKRLMLPAGIPYVDAYEGMSDFEAIEAVVVFDDIYPKRVGEITDVSSYESEVDNEDGTKTKATFYRFTDTGINFSKEYILEGQELKIKFESGKLNGMEFGVMFNPLGLTEKNDDGSWNPDAQLWEIVQNEDYGRPLPDEVLLPKIGDKYVLSGWNAEKITELGLVASAEQEVFAAAKKYVAKTCIDDGTYTATLNSIWVHKDQINHSFDVGQRINLINPAYFKAGRKSRVIGFEINLDLPYNSPQYTIGESTAYSRLSDIETQVEELTFKGQTFTGSGGSNIYVIKTNDSTAASNFNVFSALRTLGMFLRKDTTDVAGELITFLKGLLIGKNGSGITVRKDGTTQAVVDRLYVKIKAVFDELQVKKATHVGGEQVITHAGMKCIKVEELKDTYRCYFLAEQEGEAIANEFSVGSLAQAKECNIVEGTTLNASNRYYWREVMAVGRDYIDLSKTICDEGSDAPQAGDDIIGLGHRNDVDLQSAIVLSSTSETSPSITLYTGIKDFNLTEKDVISFGVDKATGHAYMKVYGDENSYFKFDKDGLEVKGKFFSSTSGKLIESELNNVIADIEDIRSKTDKIMIIWQEAYIPTLTNLPASEWNTEALRAAHEQDLFYNTSKNPAVGGGRCYRWEVLDNGAYGWNEITDKDTIAALEAAASKKRIFLSQPTINSDYDAGDMWVNATYADKYDNDSLVCITAKKAGEAFSISHWRPSTKITSSYIKQMEDKIEAAVLVTAVDKDGNVISTNKNGLVLTKDFSKLMSSYSDEAGIVSKAEISTFISDDNGNFTSNASIRADRIDFIGRTMINGNFVVDTNGHVTMNDFTANNGVFNGTVNAIAGSFENVTVRDINSPGDPFHIDRYGYFYGNNIEVQDAKISGKITATDAIFEKGTFQHGVFENITLKKSINTPSDNLYIDAVGAVTVKGNVTATGGSIAGWIIDVNSIRKNNVVLGADGSIYNSNGSWHFGNDKTGYLAGGNISWDESGDTVLNNITANNLILKGNISGANAVLNDITANGTINASSGRIGDYLYLHGNGISTNPRAFMTDLTDGTTQFELSKSYYLHAVGSNSGVNTIQIRPYHRVDGEAGSSSSRGIVTISANVPGRNRALHVSAGESFFGGDVIVGKIYAPSSGVLEIAGPIKTQGVYQNTDTVYSSTSYSIKATDQTLLFFWNCTITLPSSADGHEVWIMPNGNTISFSAGTFANASGRTSIDGYKWHVMKRVSGSWYLSWMSV